MSTASLLARARSGDSRARNVLLERHRPRLVRWVHGRLPIRARDGVDTDDIVQNTLFRALNPMERFEPRHEGAFWAYLCRIAQHQIVDQCRKADRRPERVELGDDQVGSGPSPLDLAIGRDNLRRFEEALDRLSEDWATAIRLKLEFQFTYVEIASAMGLVTENAARLLVQRAMKRLAREMHERRTRE
jgi:RNA polymerase sigma factor (sigma-70 family)